MADLSKLAADATAAMESSSAFSAFKVAADETTAMETSSAFSEFSEVSEYTPATQNTDQADTVVDNVNEADTLDASCVDTGGDHKSGSGTGTGYSSHDTHFTSVSQQ